MSAELNNINLIEIPCKKQRPDGMEDIEISNIVLDPSIISFFADYDLFHLVEQIEGKFVIDLQNQFKHFNTGHSELNETILEYISPERLKTLLKDLSLNDECVFLKALQDWRNKRSNRSSNNLKTICSSNTNTQSIVSIFHYSHTKLNVYFYRT